MARTKGYLEKYADSKKTSTGSTLSSKISNARARIADVGEEKDTRNAIEKFLGLPENQNLLFDLAELVNRPQQAIFGAIDAAQTGYDIGEAAMSGLKGEEFTYGGDILRNAGMEDSQGVGIDDILGFGLDIFADPLDVAAIPVKTAAGGVKLISGTEAIVKGAKAGVKGTAKALDFGTETLLKASDARKGIKYLDEFAKDPLKLGKKVADDAASTAGNLELYKGLKKKTGEAFNYRKAIPGDLVGKAAKEADKADFAKDVVTRQFKNLDDVVVTEAAKQGKPIAQLNKEYKMLAQADAMKKQFTIKEMITSGKTKTFKLASPEDVSSVSNELSKLGIKVSIKDNVVTIGKIPKEVKANQKLLDTLEGITVNRDLIEEAKFLEDIGKLTDDPELMNFYKNYHPDAQYEQVNKVFRDITGFDMSPKDKKAFYDRFTLANTRKATGTTGTFGAKKSEFTTFTEDAIRADKAEIISKKLDRKIEKEISNLPDNQISKLEETISRKQDEIAQIKTKLSKDLGKRGAKTKKLYNKISEKAAKRSRIDLIFTKDMLKKYEKMLPGEDLDKLISFSNKVGKKEIKFLDLQKELLDTTLTSAQVDAILNKMTKLNDDLTDAVAKTEAMISKADKVVTDSSMAMISKATKYGDEMSENAVKSAKLKEKLTTFKQTTKDIAERSRDSIASRVDDIEYFTNKLDNLKGSNIAEQTAIIKRKIKNIEMEKEYISNLDFDKLYTESFTETFADYINQTTEYVKGRTVLNEILLSETIRDPSLMRVVSKTNQEVPKGMVAVDGNTIIQKMSDGWGEFVDKSAIERFAGEIKGERVLLDKSIHNMMFNTVTKKEANEFIKIIDKTNNMFKKLKTFTPGFHMRNMIGNPTNMWLSGMPMMEYTKYVKKSTKMWGKVDDVLDKVAMGAKLSTEELKIFDTIQEFASAGLYKSGTKVLDLDEILKQSMGKGKKGFTKNIYDKAFESNAKLNSSVDAYNRLALFLYAKENPKYLKLHDLDDAGAVVRKVLFDPNDLSSFEKNTMKKLIPFYTFTKQNLFFQIDNIARNPIKYKRLIKTTNKLWDDNFDEDEFMQWQKEGMSIPVPFLQDSDGNPLMFKLNLPISDLGEFLENPTQRALASLTPIIRAPIETVTGKEIFTGRDVSTISPLDYIAKNTGLDVFTKQLSKPGDLAESENFGDSFSTLFPSVASPVNKENNITSNQYQELEELTAYIKKLKDTGVAVRDINEVEETAKQRVARLKKERKKNT